MKRSTRSQRHGFGGVRRIVERARQLVDEADQAADNGENDAAQRLYEESLNLFRQVDDADGILNSLGGLAWLSDKRQDYAAARSQYEECIRLARSLKSTGFLAQCLSGLASVLVMQGEQPQANVLAKEALELYRYQENSTEIANAMVLLGSTASEVEEARTHYEQALLLYRDLGDPEDVVVALCCIGFLAAPNRDNSRERDCLEEALRLHEQSDQKQCKSYALNNLGNIERYEGNYDRAASLYNESLLMKQEIGDIWAIAYTLEGCAALAVLLKQGERAARLFGAAFTIRERLGTPLEPIKTGEYDDNLAAARKLLTPEIFGAEWKEGIALSVTDAVDYAIDAAKGLNEACSYQQAR